MAACIDITALTADKLDLVQRTTWLSRFMSRDDDRAGVWAAADAAAALPTMGILATFARMQVEVERIRPAKREVATTSFRTISRVLMRM